MALHFYLVYVAESILEVLDFKFSLKIFQSVPHKMFRRMKRIKFVKMIFQICFLKDRLTFVSNNVNSTESDAGCWVSEKASGASFWHGGWASLASLKTPSSAWLSSPSRVDIWRDRCDRWSCKFLASFVNFQKTSVTAQQFTQSYCQRSCSHHIWVWTRLIVLTQYG